MPPTSPSSWGLREPPNPITNTLVLTERAPFFTLMGHSREGAIHCPWWEQGPREQLLFLSSLRTSRWNDGFHKPRGKGFFIISSQ